jgi:hypothetical protein
VIKFGNLSKRDIDPGIAPCFTRRVAARTS